MTRSTSPLLERLASLAGPRRYRTGAALVVAACLLLLAFEVRPRLLEAHGRYGAWQRAEAELEAAARWEGEAASVTRERARLAARFDTLVVDLPRTGEISPVLEHLERGARQAGATLAAVEPLEGEGGAAYDRLPLRVVVRGSFAAVHGFVRRAEGSQYLMKVRRLALRGPDLGRPTERGTEAELEAELLIELVVLRGSLQRGEDP